MYVLSLWLQGTIPINQLLLSSTREQTQQDGSQRTRYMHCETNSVLKLVLYMYMYSTVGVRLCTFWAVTWLRPLSSSGQLHSVEWAGDCRGSTRQRGTVNTSLRRLDLLQGIIRTVLVFMALITSCTVFCMLVHVHCMQEHFYSSYWNVPEIKCTVCS